MTIVQVPFKVGAIEPKPGRPAQGEVCVGDHDIPGKQGRWRLMSPAFSPGLTVVLCDDCYQKAFAINESWRPPHAT